MMGEVAVAAAAWVWLRCCFRRSGSVPWTLDYRRGWVNYAIFSAFSMGTCFEAKPSAISVPTQAAKNAKNPALAHGAFTYHEKDQNSETSGAQCVCQQMNAQWRRKLQHQK